MDVSYFSMEIWLADGIPTYSGGLGVLAGDTLRALADAGVACNAVTLLYTGGYFRQEITEEGTQRDEAVVWDPSAHLEPLDVRASFQLEGRTVHLKAWRYVLTGVGGHQIPVVLLDTDVEENAAEDRTLCDRLYGGDTRHRIRQEAVLGLGGVAILDALEQRGRTLHMNEGHASLLALELYARAREDGLGEAEARASTRGQCVFTTHTPVPAGHDRFEEALVNRHLPPRLTERLAELPATEDGHLNMTLMGLALAGYVNGVAKRHGEVSREMFPDYEIDAITNGVHAVSWTSSPIAEVFDERCAGWREDNQRLRAMAEASIEGLREAHRAAKQQLIDEVERRVGTCLSVERFTIGFARRKTPYKRALLLLSDIPRLAEIAERHGGLQVVYAGKAHPKDTAGQSLVREIHAIQTTLPDQIKLVFLPNYETDLGRLITAGVDVWLNTPRPPMEASGTSGMKAVLNGVPNLSVDDGWWCEGYVPGKTGWRIDASIVAAKGDATDSSAEAAHDRAEQLSQLTNDDDRLDAAQLYALLDEEVLPAFADAPRWGDIMRHCIALGGSHFNAQRMALEYIERAYRL
ncbi:MAG: alpha-glucan family phosphorylase [Nannocystaceae bacterium]